MVDVAISGAGPAGTALAIHLGRSGFRVALFERATFPREKPCGEGLMPLGVAALDELGVPTRELGADFFGARYSAGGRVAEGDFPPGSTPGRGLRRRDLDAALALLASRTPGVSLHTGARVTAPLLEDGRVRGLLVEGQPVRARLVVAADGAQSRLRHSLGLSLPAPRKRIGMRMHFRSAAGTPARTRIEIFLAPGRELYLTPLPRGEFLVAALAQAAALQGSPETSFRNWCLAVPALAERVQDAEPVSDLLVTAPLSGRAHRRVLPGCVLLGDAAGFTDPITGGGMAQALQSARLLAAHLAAQGDWSLAVLEEFDRRREALLRDYRRVTSALLWLARHPFLIPPALGLLRSIPAFFSHLLGVSGGVRGLFRLSPPPLPAAAPRPVSALQEQLTS